LNRSLKILALCLLAVFPARGRDREADLRADMAFLTDSLQAGRAMGSTGGNRVTVYLYGQMRNAGLQVSVQTFSEGGRLGRNVIGITPGSYRRYIVVSTYYDGLGTLDGTLYPGADSNASGVTALLDLLRELPARPAGDTGIIFVAFDGHNADLAGSRVFMQRFRREYPISLMANLDILGSSLVPLHRGQADYLMVLGGAPWRRALEAANRETHLDLAYDYYGSRSFTDLFYRRVGDQRWALEAGIPAVMFTSGITLNTNKRTDTPDTIEFAVLERRILLIANWLRNQLQ